jgi:hypothetical protein
VLDTVLWICIIWFNHFKDSRSCVIRIYGFQNCGMNNISEISMSPIRPQPWILQSCLNFWSQCNIIMCNKIVSYYRHWLCDIFGIRVSDQHECSVRWNVFDFEVWEVLNCWWLGETRMCTDSKQCSNSVTYLVTRNTDVISTVAL